MKLEICLDEEIEDVIDLVYSTTIGELYFGSNRDRVQGMVQRELGMAHILTAKNEQDKLVGVLIHDEKGAFGKYPYLHIIAVTPEYQNLGFGSKILSAYEEKYKASKLFLFVSETNFRAKALYERLGYAELGKIDGFYIKNQAEILMVKSLV